MKVKLSFLIQHRSLIKLLSFLMIVHLINSIVFIV
jgi:hypothetical protein